jgi:lysocardiolipin and lysophospholipid acyltransferase
MAEIKQPDSLETCIPAGEITAGIMESKSKRGAANGDFSRKANVSNGAVHDFHPSGKKSYGRTMQIVRAVTFFVYFMMCCSAYVYTRLPHQLASQLAQMSAVSSSVPDISTDTSCACSIFATQLIGAPLYFLNREWYYAYMSLTKRSFAITTTVMTNIWSPTTIRISGDASVAAELIPTAGGGVRFDFPERIVLIANHQIYTDWLYLWWVAYANQPGTHGHFYIILKESLKYIPIIGWGMMFYSFIFMSRKMATDQPRLAYRLKKLCQTKTDPAGKSYLDPMWLLLFPEGTNLSGNGRVKSANWAKKNGLKDAEHVMLPRSTGSFFCLNELKSTVEYVYDCTVAYEGIP